MAMRTYRTGMIGAFGPGERILTSAVFLLGYVLAGGLPDLKGLLAFLIVQVCVQGGASAFGRSFEAEPSTAPAWLRPVGLALLLIGIVSAPVVGIDFWAICAAVIVLSVGYRHPVVRWKARPVGSLLVPAIARGLLGFDLGVLAARTQTSYFRTPHLLAGAVACTAVATAIQLLIQMRDVEEDRGRGDRTAAVALGLPPGSAARALGVAYAVLGAVCVYLIARYLTSRS